VIGKEFAITITVILCFESIHTQAIIKIPLEFSEILASNQMISQRAKVEPHGDQPRWWQQSSRYSEKHSTQRAGLSPLQTRRVQRAFLDTAVYRVSRRLTLGISNFPSWSQSTWCNCDI